jgi:peptidoglycan/xylan/chitin deacetylase (PgdA/CDA1 family)
MTVDWASTLLLYQEGDLRRYGFSPSDFAARGIPTLKVPHADVATDPAVLHEIRVSGCEALIFLRNDDMEGHPQVGRILRELRLGYTAVSAIDAQASDDQTRACIRDLLSGMADVPIRLGQADTTCHSRKTRGTCSFVFDLEQFGGARYGMPRLLPLLEASHIRATFFVTGFIAEVFPSLVRRICQGGHELGVHGSVHEFLQGRSLEEQEKRVRGQVALLAAQGPVHGANFIFRMDDLSPEALARCALKYFVLFRKHLFQRTRFIPASGRLRPFRAPSGDLTMIPIGVETYGLSWHEIRASVNSAWKTAVREGLRHVTVLLHPFKDGTIARIHQTGRLIQYMLVELGLQAVPLAEIPEPRSRNVHAVRFRYRWDENEAGSLREDAASHSISWWSAPMYHARRVENLADALEANGTDTVLSAAPGPRMVYVYPDSAGGSSAEVQTDPLLAPRRAAKEIMTALHAGDVVTVSPRGPWRDRLRKVLFHVPRSFRDLSMILRRVCIRMQTEIRRVER